MGSVKGERRYKDFTGAIVYRFIILDCHSSERGSTPLGTAIKIIELNIFFPSFFNVVM